MVPRMPMVALGVCTNISPVFETWPEMKVAAPWTRLSSVVLLLVAAGS